MDTPQEPSSSNEQPVRAQPEGGSGAAAAAAAAAEGTLAAGGAQVMVLDELDSGVGGRLGGPVARLLRLMCGPRGGGAASQILCVSHLPQVLTGPPCIDVRQCCRGR